jgi:ribosomal protein S18 acetylase RimI-like enzyme
MRVRAYEAGDLERLYEICLRTGDAGTDATEVLADPRLLGEIYAAPYALLEPEHAFVLDDGAGQAVGYVLAALDTRRFEARCEAEWWPALRRRYPVGAGDAPLDELLVGMLHHPPLAEDDVLAGHPSHLHIDLLPEAQGSGWGRALMEAVHGALRADGSTGVHLGVSTRNHRAIGFYTHLGYERLTGHDLSHTMGFSL